MADLSKLAASEQHLVKNYEALLAKVAELADKLSHIVVEDPAVQTQINAIADELEAEAVKSDPAAPAEGA